MSSHSGAGLTRFVCFYLIPCYCIFLLNTSNYSCFVAACRLLFFPVGIACLIFTFLLLYYMTSLLHLYLCRRNGTNCGQTVPKKWIIHCIHSFVSFFRFFFSPLPRLSALSLKTMSNLVAWHALWEGLSVGELILFFMPSTYPFLKNLALDTFGTHRCIPYVFPVLSPLRQRYFFKFS